MKKTPFITLKSTFVASDYVSNLYVTRVDLASESPFPDFLIFFILTVPRQCFYVDHLFIIVFRVCLCHTVLSVPCSLVVTCWERADLLLWFLVFLSRLHMVSWVRCGASLYRFLIFAYFITMGSESSFPDSDVTRVETPM